MLHSLYVGYPILMQTLSVQLNLTPSPSILCTLMKMLKIMDDSLVQRIVTPKLGLSGYCDT